MKKSHRIPVLAAILCGLLLLLIAADSHLDSVCDGRSFGLQRESREKMNALSELFFDYRDTTGKVPVSDSELRSFSSQKFDEITGPSQQWPSGLTIKYENYGVKDALVVQAPRPSRQAWYCIRGSLTFIIYDLDSDLIPVPRVMELE